MLVTMFALSPSAWATDPVRITVQAPGVQTVVLDCQGKRYEAPVRGGVATFTQNPGKCEVLMLATVGAVDGAGQYQCGMNGCTQVDVIHKDIEARADRVTIVVTDQSTTLLELKCPSGYRMRANVDTNTAVFDGVPTEDCELMWKGGVTPAKAHRIRPGTWYCQATGSTGVCQSR